MSDQPEIIDVTGLVEDRPGALARVGRALEGPCTSWGIFHVVGHDRTQEATRAFGAAMAAFFDQPREVKLEVRRRLDNARGFYDEELTKNRRDWKEVFDYGADLPAGDLPAAHSDGVNQWPANLPGFRETMLEHLAACERIGLALLRALCVSLDLAPDTLTDAFARSSSFVRLNRYPACPEPAPADTPLLPERGHLGVHHHSDAGALTLLYQDEVAGLQARRDDAWIVVEPVPDALTVNLGDMLQVWSNDRYRSPLHRVLADAERTRHSAPFFMNPSYETTCAPLPELLAAGEPARFRPISWAHFRDRRSAGDYADYGAEIQIDDYRIAPAARDSQVGIRQIK